MAPAPDTYADFYSASRRPLPVTSDTPISVECGDESWTCRLGAHCEANRDSIPHAERVLMVSSLARDGVYHGRGWTARIGSAA